MLSRKALNNIKKTKAWAKSTPKSNPTKIIECDENSQIFNWQRTNKKASYKDYNVEQKLKIENDTRSNKNRRKL